MEYLAISIGFGQIEHISVRGHSRDILADTITEAFEALSSSQLLASIENTLNRLRSMGLDPAQTWQVVEFLLAHRRPE